MATELPSLDKVELPLNRATSLYPQANLYRVDSQLYRSEQLHACESHLLTTYGIDAIINLRFFDRNDNEAHLKTLHNIELYNHPLMTWYVSPKRLAAILWRIEQLHSAQKSVLVHCYHGSDRTGIVVAMYRIIYQRWSIEAAKAEMVDGEYGFHSFWINLVSLLDDKEVNEVKRELAQLRP